MAIRKIIKINLDKCNGCGLCIPNCPEGALQVIDGKARLISDLFCDGLGACIGHCPQGAITVGEREARGYDERQVMANIVRQGENVIRAHLVHLKEHGQEGYLKQAIDYLNEKIKGQKVYLKYDDKKYDEQNNLLAYLYLWNKTFINAHLIKNGLTSADDKMNFKYKDKFFELSGKYNG